MQKILFVLESFYYMIFSFFILLKKIMRKFLLNIIYRVLHSFDRANFLTNTANKENAQRNHPIENRTPQKYIKKRFNIVSRLDLPVKNNFLHPTKLLVYMSLSFVCLKSLTTTIPDLEKLFQIRSQIFMNC